MNYGMKVVCSVVYVEIYYYDYVLVKIGSFIVG